MQQLLTLPLFFSFLRQLKLSRWTFRSLQHGQHHYNLERAVLFISSFKTKSMVGWGFGSVFKSPAAAPLASLVSDIEKTCVSWCLGGDGVKGGEQELETEANCGFVLPCTIWQIHFLAYGTSSCLSHSPAQACFYLSFQQKWAVAIIAK